MSTDDASTGDPSTVETRSPTPTLLHQPHHDGSALYVSTPHPALGDTVRVRVRIPNSAEVTAVHVRLTPDAEPAFATAVVDQRTDTETWWAADVVCHNPVTNYRFLLEGGPAAYQWVNGTGVHLRDVPDAADFRLVAHPSPPPEWASGASVYQVFPDRFARSARADDRPVPDWAVPAAWDDEVSTEPDTVASQLYGGDLDGIVERLDHIVDLGFTVLYLTPFFPSRSNHRYDASTFTEVDPVLGGTEALGRLVDACHARGLRVMGDFTANHTGAAHEWFETAQQDPASVERGFYFWDGPQVGADYVGWLGVASLPKLDYDSDELHRRVLEDPDGVVRHWLSGDHALDGWRVDVANMTGRHGAQDHNHTVAEAMRTAVAQTSPEALLIGEHCHDYTRDAQGLGWHGVMNYAGFTRPIWTWLRDEDYAPSFLGSPVKVPRLGGRSVMETMREFAAGIPWTSLTHSFALAGSHDTTRIRSLVGDDSRQVDVAAGLLFTLPGVPMVTYGDEIGMPGDFGEDGRRPMPWGSEDGPEWDGRLLAVYRALVAARAGSVALREGGLRWVHADDDCLVYLRETAGECALVHAARDAHDDVVLDLGNLSGLESATAIIGGGAGSPGATTVLSADHPLIEIWTWVP